jgi:putative NADPH-quinone reductase
MKILAINASHRGDNGHTRVLLGLLGEGINQTGAEYEIVTLARHKINRCLACGKCHQPEQHLQCVYREKDDVADIFEKISRADQVIYATPVYLFGMSGLLKTFLDRMYATSDVYQMKVTRGGLFFHHIDEAICSKPFVSLICCDNLDPETPKNARDYFRTFARFMDAPQVGELVRNGGRLFGYGRDPQAAERFPKIDTVYAAYRQAGYELAQKGQISPATQRRANQEVIPVPFFGLLKHLRPFKQVMVAKAEKYFG